MRNPKVMFATIVACIALLLSIQATQVLGQVEMAKVPEGQKAKVLGIINTLETLAVEPFTKNVSTKPEPTTADPIAMPREVAEQLPLGTRDFKTSPKIGPTINLDRRKTSTWKQRKADLELAEGQLIALAENANGIALIPQTIEEMTEKAALVAGIIDDSYVLTYMPKISLSENQIDRNIVVTSKRPDVIIQGRRRVVPKRN